MKSENRIKTVLTLVFTAMAFVILAVMPANAEIVLEEQFIYEAADINGRDGGIGFDGPWNSDQSHGQHYKTGLVTFNVGDGTTINEDTGLYFADLPVAGSALSRYGNAGRAQAHRIISSESQAVLTADDTTIWFGFLLSAGKDYRNFMFSFGTESIKHSNDTFDFAVAGDGFGVATTDADGSGDGTINAFVFDGSEVATFFSSTFKVGLQPGGTHNDTVLIVGKINWKANGTPDEYFLFNVTDLSTEPSEADAIVSITADLDQSVFDTVAIYDGSISIIDEIRFGTSFVNVVGIDDPYAPVIDAGDSWITWSGDPVTLDATVTEQPGSDWTNLTYDWSADPADGVVITPNADPADPTVTITKAAPTGDATVVTLTLSVASEGKEPRKASISIHVYDDACDAAVGAGVSEIDPSDFNADCVTNILDVAMMAAEWLVDYALTVPVTE